MRQESVLCAFRLWIAQNGVLLITIVQHRDHVMIVAVSKNHVKRENTLATNVLLALKMYSLSVSEWGALWGRRWLMSD
jgi:hypothetical protein